MSDSEVSVVEAARDTGAELAVALAYYEIGPAYHLQKMLSIALAVEIGATIVHLTSHAIWG